MLVKGKKSFFVIINISYVNSIKNKRSVQILRGVKRIQPCWNAEMQFMPYIT